MHRANVGSVLNVERVIQSLQKAVPRYRNPTLIGQGSFAYVFHAVDSKRDRSVALKVVHAGNDAEARAEDRFLLEAKILHKLDNENVVRLYDFGHADEFPFMVFEFVDGMDLRDYVEREGPLPPYHVLDLMLQITHGLRQAHSLNIVHRDLKPENILVTREGLVKVSDFGLAKVLDQRAPDLTQSGLCLGTPMYMAPEICRGEPLTPAADVYALGILIYELVAGHPPFHGDNEIEVFEHQLKTDAPPLPRRGDPLHDGLAEIACRCLRKDPTHRPTDAASLHDRLESVKSGKGRYVDTLPEGVPRPDRGQSRDQFVKAHGPLLALAAISVLSLLVVLAFRLSLPLDVRIVSGARGFRVAWRTRFPTRGRVTVHPVDLPGQAREVVEGAWSRDHDLVVGNLQPEGNYKLGIGSVLGLREGIARRTEATLKFGRVAATWVVGGVEITAAANRPTRITARIEGSPRSSRSSDVLPEHCMVLHPEQGLLDPRIRIHLTLEDEEGGKVEQTLAPSGLLSVLAHLDLEKDFPASRGTWSWSPHGETPITRSVRLTRAVPKPLVSLWHVQDSGLDSLRVAIDSVPGDAARFETLQCLTKLPVLDRAATLWRFPSRFSALTALVQVSMPCFAVRRAPGGESLAVAHVAEGGRSVWLTPTIFNGERLDNSVPGGGTPSRHQVGGKLELSRRPNAGRSCLVWIEVSQLQGTVALEFSLSDDRQHRIRYWLLGRLEADEEGLGGSDEGRGEGVPARSTGAQSGTGEGVDPWGGLQGQEALAIGLEGFSGFLGFRLQPWPLSGTQLEYSVRCVTVPGCNAQLATAIAQVGVTEEEGAGP